MNASPLEGTNAMNAISLRPARPESDFSRLAAWFTILEGETNTEESLTRYFERDRDRILRVMVAEESAGAPLGFSWLERSRANPNRAVLSLYVLPEHRRQGIGSRLYADLEQAARELVADRLRVSIWDNTPADRGFAERRGFAEHIHSMAFSLDLATFDDRPYDAIIERLKAEGFHFTSMEELGNTEEAQRRLYILNDTAAASTLGSDGEHPWESFEDFQQHVCQTDWYKPGGQFVAIDTATGNWAAMSAITRLEGNDYAYNLFTGVDFPYRGRKLAQAVKVHALRYARDVLKATSVHTNHNSKNPPILAIDRKLGYVQIPGLYVMEKAL